MKEQGLYGHQKRAYRIQTTDRADPDRRITCIRTAEGWLYLAAILDLYSRKIVGWSAGACIDTTLIGLALQMALTRRQPPARLIFHSDRGVQYASGDYRDGLAGAGLNEPQSQLLRQCLYGKLLEHPQAGADLPA